MTHGKPYVTRHAKKNACRTHGLHGNGEVYKSGGKSVHRVGEEQKGNEGKKRKKKKKKRKKKEKKEKRKKKERKRRKRAKKSGKKKSAFRRSKLIGPRIKVYIFDEGYTPRGRNSFYFGLFSTIRVVGLCLCPKRLFGRISKYGNATLF